MAVQFGGKVNKHEIKKFSKSKHWDGKRFCNLQETNMKIPLSAAPGLIYNQLFNRKGLKPKQNIPVVSFNKHAFLADSETFKFVWLGHAALLFRINGKTILIDPMLGDDAAPVAPFKIKRYNDISLNLIEDLPEIDLLILSHDHYDHLDYKSIKLLSSKVNHYFVALGVQRHLVKWGVSKALISEFDWWETKSFGDLAVSFTPTQHFSGRGLRDRNKGLWGGWTFKSERENIWFSGDGGYGAHFKEIGEKLGPFDVGFMECGQYNKLWENIHLFPEQSVQAGIEAKVKTIIPVHWGSFTLSDHHWTDPAERFIASCQTASAPYLTPRIGELIVDLENHKNESWWQEMD
jgi:L-ascorbate metabolism protein UlaG (beta-lactamase superfamily)